MKPNQNKLYDIGFVALLLVAAFFTLPWHQGFTIGDCADYLRAANDLLDGKWEIQNNFYANRIGTYLPYALGMGWFGFGKSLTAITTIEYLLLLMAVYFVIGKYNKAAAFISTSLLGVSALMHQSAGVIMGDIAIALCANSVVLFYFYFIFYSPENQRSSKFYGILLCLLMVMAFLVKESVIFYLPLMVWSFWNDRKKEGMKLFLKYAVLLLFISGLTIVAVYWFKTGDPFYRVHAVETGPSASDSNYNGANWLTILNRITWQPFQFLVENFSFGCMFVLSVLQFVRTKDSASRQELFLKAYFIIPLLIWWLGSQGFTTYNPVALVPRLWLPLLVPMAINSAFFILHILGEGAGGKDRKRVVIVAIVFIFLSFITLFISHENYKALNIRPPTDLRLMTVTYAALVFFVITLTYINRSLKIMAAVRGLFFCVVFLPLLFICFQHILWWGDKKMKGIKEPYDIEKEMMQYMASLPPHPILADHWMPTNHYIFTDFKSQLSFTDYSHIDSIPQNAYLILNKHRQAELLNNLTETKTFTRANNIVPDFAIAPERYGFILIRENETDLLYQFTNNK